jgi:hypothetical protein
MIADRVTTNNISTIDNSGRNHLVLTLDGFTKTQIDIKKATIKAISIIS